MVPEGYIWSAFPAAQWAGRDAVVWQTRSVPTPPGTRAPHTRARVRAGASIAVALGVMNVLNYGYTVLAAHTVGRQAYGAFAALLGVLLVVNVLSLGLQATGVRRISTAPGAAEEVEQVLLSVGLRTALAIGALTLALAPVLNAVLHLDSLASAVLVAVAAVPLTYMGAQAGVLQGERRWTPLALVYLAQGVGRIGVGLLLMLVWPTELAAMAGVALGAWLPVVIAHVALRQRRPALQGTAAHPRLDLIREVMSSSQALLAFFALSNVDILLARANLSASEAGLYAGGLLLTKAILFLPQFVVVIAFPTMASRGAPRRTLLLALGLVAPVGLVGVAAVLTLPDLALTFIGGDDFRGVQDELWRFALVGTVLSMLQILVYAVLAGRRSGVLWAVWAALILLIVVAPTAASASFLVLVVMTVDGVLLVGLLGAAMATSRAAFSTSVLRSSVRRPAPDRAGSAKEQSL
jgi:O-antigen/teichoic acid export membrane protein